MYTNPIDVPIPEKITPEEDELEQAEFDEWYSQQIERGRELDESGDLTRPSNTEMRAVIAYRRANLIHQAQRWVRELRSWLDVESN